MQPVSELLAAAILDFEAGRLREAADRLNQIVQSEAACVAAWHYLAATLLRGGDFQAAASAAGRALDLDPTFSAAANTLGLALEALGDLAGATSNFERSAELDPHRASFLYNVGRMRQRLGKYEQAADWYGRAIALKPDYHEAHCNLGVARFEQGRLAEAAAALQMSLSVAPAYAEAKHNLAVVLLWQGRWSDAEALIKEVLRDDPEDAAAWVVCGLIAQKRGEIEIALAMLQKAEAIRPEARIGSEVLLTMQYAGQVSPEKLLEVHCQWDAKYGRATWTSTQGERQKRSIRRIGFLSKDFRQHPVTFFTLPLLEQLRQHGILAVGYCDSALEDAFTFRVRAACEKWHTTRGWSDAEVARQIAEDGIDVLIDLMGHTGERMRVFALRPAAMQLTWAGYVGTTGLTAMDFLLADQVHVRPGEERFYTEKVLWMPQGYVCYRPPGGGPEIAELPALRSGRVTFGCFNNPAKYSADALNAWAEILRQTPESQLLLMYGGLDDAGMQQRILGAFKDRGIAEGRVTLAGARSRNELLQGYDRVDLGLDTQPYSGGVTTCESLWMGVPVVTLPGLTFAGRHSTSHLVHAGYPQFVADDWGGYVRLAVTWAQRPNDLAGLRLGMRRQVQASSLCDAAQFAKDFVAVLSRAWLNND